MNNEKLSFKDQLQKARISYSDAIDVEDLVVDEVRKFRTGFAFNDPSEGIEKADMPNLINAISERIRGHFPEMGGKQVDVILDILESQFSKQNPGGAGSLKKENEDDKHIFA